MITKKIFIFLILINIILLSLYINNFNIENSPTEPESISDMPDKIESLQELQELDIVYTRLYLYENCEKYNIDTDSIGIMGYSAGAHLAMLYSYTPNETKDVMNIKYCLSFAGPTKFYGEELQDFSPETIGLIENLFGGTCENEEKEREYMQGSPYAYIDYLKDLEDWENKVPLLLAHDETDDVVPFSQSQIIYDKATEAGIECQLLKLRGFGHQINFNNYSKNDETVRTILDFIYKYS